MKGPFICSIIEKRQLAPEIFSITVEKPSEMTEITSGQFMNIQCGEGLFPLLRRPISVCQADNNKIQFVVRVAGKGTELLCSRKVGDTLDILGPLGNGFTIDDKMKDVLIVGGGIGTAPLVELTKNLKDKRTRVILGFRSQPYLIDEFETYAKNVQVATEDGSCGHKGYVTDLAIEEIKSEKPDLVYACGPEIMLKRVQEICVQYGIPSQLSIEERMACGIGGCLVCSCKVKAEEAGWKYVRTCKEGPAFSGEEVIFHD
ncbi:MAG: dihydroorotate dehydrogenase electron transfer subunit [Bacillota bacterium]